MTVAQDGGKVVSLTHQPPLPPRKSSWNSFLLEAELTPGIVRSEGLCQWKIPVTPSEIEPVTFRFVAQYLNHCATTVPCFFIQFYNNITCLSWFVKDLSSFFLQNYVLMVCDRLPFNERNVYYSMQSRLIMIWVFVLVKRYWMQSRLIMIWVFILVKRYWNVYDRCRIFYFTFALEFLTAVNFLSVNRLQTDLK
jgi:hypothetical protein